MNKKLLEIITLALWDGLDKEELGVCALDAHIVILAIKEAGYAVVPVKPIKETEINESLIAAAPDLLEALKSSLELIYFTPDGGSGVVIDQINDAIAKATGE